MANKDPNRQFRRQGESLINKRCERLRVIKTDGSIKTTGPAPIRFAAKTADNETAGFIELLPKGDHVKVTNVDVRQQWQHCNIATRLYEFAATFACRQRKTLRSDQMRSKCSDGFWRKQVKTGKASCVERGEEEVFPDDHVDDPCGAPIFNRGGCVQYELKPCTMELGRARRRNDR